MEWKIEKSGETKRVAVFNDLTGYGRCGLTVSLPIISHMKMQCCVVPTAILSNHTGYNGFILRIIPKTLPLIFPDGDRWSLGSMRF